MTVSAVASTGSQAHELWKGTLKGEVYWQSFDKINDMSGKYQFNLANLSDAAVQKIQSVGGKVTNKAGDEAKAEMGNYIVAKSKYPIKVVDRQGEDMTGVPVGNGSKCRVACKLVETTNKFGTFVLVQPMKVIIDELNIYEADEAGDINMEDAI